MNLSVQDWVDIFSALGSFAGGLAAIVGAGAASIAAIFAWRGIKKIESELVDQRDQINKLANMAKELKIQNELNQKKMSLSILPIISVSFKGTGSGFYTEGPTETSYSYSFKNFGKTAFDIDINLPSRGNGKNKIETIDELEEGKSKIIKVYLGENLGEFSGVGLEMTFRDSLYNWYSQKIHIGQKFIQVENFPPTPIDQDESLYKKRYNDRVKREKPQ